MAPKRARTKSHRPDTSKRRRLQEPGLHPASIPTDSIDHLTRLPNEILYAIVPRISAEDGLALARTSSTLCSCVLPELYRIDAVGAKETKDKVPAALVWATWEGQTTAFRASLSALKSLGVDTQTVVNRPLNSQTVGWSLMSPILKTMRESFIGGLNPSLIHVCCVRGHSDLAAALIENGGNPNLKDKAGYLPLEYVADLEMQAKFIAPMAPTDTAESTSILSKLAVRALRDSYNLDPTPNKSTRVFPVVKYLLESGYRIPPQIDQPYSHPLSHAFRLRSPELLKIMLNAGVDPNVVNNTGHHHCLLSRAIIDGSLVAASYLIDAGAEVNIPAGMKVAGVLDPMQAFVSIRYPDHAADDWKRLGEKLICKVSSVDGTIDGHPFLWQALKDGNLELAALLSKAGAHAGSKGAWISVEVLDSMGRKLAGK
ncbi:hypothetical protein SCUP234_11941 [Seiridium cupressi]